MEDYGLTVLNFDPIEIRIYFAADLGILSTKSNCLTLL
jgi:hypothetical protein